MSKYYVVADGTTIKQGTKLIARIRAITPPSETKTKIDVTSLDNEEFMTYVMSKIKETGDMSFTVGMRDSIGISAGNQEHTITFADGTTCVFWGELMSRTPSQLTSKTEALFDIVIGTTNLNAAEEETGPVWTLGVIAGA